MPLESPLRGRAVQQLELLPRTQWPVELRQMERIGRVCWELAHRNLRSYSLAACGGLVLLPVLAARPSKVNRLSCIRAISTAGENCGLAARLAAQIERTAYSAAQARRSLTLTIATQQQGWFHLNLSPANSVPRLLLQRGRR